MTTVPGRRLLLVAALSCAAVLIALGALAYSVVDRRAQASREAAAAETDRGVLCQATNETRMVIIAVLDLARGLSDDPPTPEGEEFYRRALNLLAPLDCGTID